jgi:hypothetical protein
MKWLCEDGGGRRTASERPQEQERKFLALLRLELRPALYGYNADLNAELSAPQGM